MTIALPALARCTAERACPWRWRTGAPRPCPLHDADGGQLAERAAEYGVVMASAPGDRDGQQPATRDSQ
jgi:hypothetical protein